MFNRSRKYIYTCILVGLLTGGCYSIDPIIVPPEPQDTDSYTDTDTDSDTDTNTDADTDTNTDADTDFDTETESETDCSDLDDWCVYECWGGSLVPAEPPETPAQQDLICTESSIPVQSNTAASVTLNAYSASLNLATGHIEIPVDVLDHVIGMPTIEVVNAVPPELSEMTVSNLQPATGGFNFNVSWENPFSYAEIQVRVTLELDCASADAGISDAGTGPDAGGNTRMVQSHTNLSWCFTAENPSNQQCSILNWVSSGGYCFETQEYCFDACEMAPTPIMPEPVDDGLALPFALKVEIDELIRFDRSVVLIAEHRGTRGPVEYEWRVSAGEISEDNLGGVVWDLPKDPGPHLVQVAIKNSSSAAVAGLRVRHEA